MNGRQHLAFFFDALGHRQAFFRQRMAAARFRKALDQGFGFGFEKQQAQVDIQLAQLVHSGGKQRQHRRAAGVHADGHALVIVGVDVFHQLRQQGGGQIVHAVKTGVFQNFQRHRLARAGQPANQDQLHVLAPGENGFVVR